MSASSLPRCSKCGNARGPWEPTGEVLPSGEQVMACQAGCPVVSPELADAVADMGALPMPVGTPDRLTEILARADAATPGPWCTDAWEIYQGTEYVPGVSWWIGETCRGTSTPEQDRADATFVAAARTDVPDLVSAVRLLRAGVDGLRERIAGLEKERAAVLALHRKHDDSEHCFADDETWPCNTRSALSPPAAPCDLRPGADAARRTIRDRQTVEDPTEHPHTWVTALDGDDQPARDGAGRTWVHCGICGQRKADRQTAEDPHNSPLRHQYDTPRDLPEVPW